MSSPPGFESNGTATHERGPRRQQEEQPERLGFRPRLYTDADFLAASFNRKWLVKWGLVRDQPAVLGGPKKTLKTNIAVDLSISLATATKFLDHFDVPQPVKVLLLSGESGEATLQETRRRVAKERGIDWAIDNLLWGTELPQLSNSDHLNDLANILEEHGVEVLILDPLYLCLLAGADADRAEATNYYQMGPLFHRIARTCLDVGTTPILTPHAKKDRVMDKPIELDDLAFAGIAEFTRQWVLVNRREPYTGDGKHSLHLTIGGSAGQSFFGQLEVDEGQLGENFEGRKWQVCVTTGMQAVKAKESDRAREKAEQEQADDLLVAGLIDRLAAAKPSDKMPPPSQTQLRTLSGIGRDRTDRSLLRLTEAKTFKAKQTTVKGGNGAKQKAVLYGRVVTNE